jgi:hypothetical protein
METSRNYPLLSRYCFSWCWQAQFRVLKPNKRKKQWIDLAEVQGTDADDAQKSLRYLCDRKGWQLLEVFHLRPTCLAFAFDRDADNSSFLSQEEKRKYCPRPATHGEVYRPQSPQQLRQTRQVEKQKRVIQAAYPLLADVLLATAFTS